MVHLIQCFWRHILEQGPFYQLLLKVYFGKRSILSSAFQGIFWKSIYPVLLRYILKKRSILSNAFEGIFWKNVHFIQCFLRYNLEKGPCYPVLFEVYFGKMSILSSAFWGIFWKKVHFTQCFLILRYILEVQ